VPKWTKEQESAIYDRGHNIIVSAGAGSGKTAVLSERVLEIVKGGTSILNIIVLTFTKAASEEMKDRIRTKLKKNGLLEEASKIDLAYITTFDSFSLSIVKKYSYLLNIDKNINILDNSILTIKKEEILDSIFDKLYQDNNNKFLNLVNAYTLKDDKELKLSILSLYNKINNLINKDTFNKYYKEYFVDSNINKLINEYMNVLYSKIEELKLSVENLCFYTDVEYSNKLYEVINPLLSSRDYIDITKNCYIKLPMLKGVDDTVKERKKQVKSILDEINDLTKYNSLEEISNTLYSTKPYIEEIITLINMLDNELMTYKRKYNSYEFNDIARLSIKLLQDNLDIQEELKDTYKEILIDEYQDTNDLQDTLMSMISNNNLYMVGDIKQSIYRFRNANPNIFKSKYDTYSKNILGSKIDLNKNFRSRREVLYSINLIFNMIMDNDIGGANYKDTHQMIFGLTNYDNINNSNYDLSILNYEYNKDSNYTKSEIEIFMIARDIQDKLNNKYTIMDKETNKERVVTYSDFAILLDRSSEFNLYKKIFEYIGLPINIIRDDTISDSEDISIIKNIYSLIISIKNKDFSNSFTYSYIAIARSYLYNIPDNEIFKIIKTRLYAGTDIYKICYNLAKEIDILTNKELFLKIIEEFNFYERIMTTKDIDKHISVLESINKVIDSSDCIEYTIYDFYNYLSRIYEEGIDIKLTYAKESGSAVKLMTIHASKGLEYPIIYMAGLYKKFNIDDLKNKFYFDNTYGFIIPFIDDGMKSSILKVLLKNKYLKEEVSEKLRLFYVALTRAREKIILVGNFNKNELSFKDNTLVDNITRYNYRSIQDILDSVYDSLSKYIDNIDIESIGLSKEYNKTKVKDISNLVSNGESIEVEDIDIESNIISKKHFSKDSISLYNKEQLNNINLGLRMHSLLENINFERPNYDGMNDFERCCIKRFINTGILNDYVKLYREYEFMYDMDMVEYHGIIDLLIIKKDIAIIVDYKLKHTTDDAYLKQLKGYKEYIKMITNMNVDTYLYSIIDSKLVKLDV